MVGPRALAASLGLSDMFTESLKAAGFISFQVCSLSVPHRNLNSLKGVSVAFAELIF